MQKNNGQKKSQIDILWEHPPWQRAMVWKLRSERVLIPTLWYKNHLIIQTASRCLLRPSSFLFSALKRGRFCHVYLRSVQLNQGEARKPETNRTKNQNTVSLMTFIDILHEHEVQDMSMCPKVYIHIFTNLYISIQISYINTNQNILTKPTTNILTLKFSFSIQGTEVPWCAIHRYPLIPTMVFYAPNGTPCPQKTRNLICHDHDGTIS